MRRLITSPRTALALAAVGLSVVAALTATAPTRAANVAVSIVEPNYDVPDTWTFDPQNIKVKVGDTVTWTNKGTDPHDVTASDGSFKSGPEGNMNPGDTWSYTFTTPGKFAYICQAHAFIPAMSGVVEVEP